MKAKLMQIEQIKKSNNAKELQRFLGMLPYLLKFVENLSRKQRI